MEKRWVEGTYSNGKAPWIPLTPARVVMSEPPPLIYTAPPLRPDQALPVEPDFSMQRLGYGPGTMPQLDHMPFGDLLALANTASIAFARAPSWSYPTGLSQPELFHGICGGAKDPPYGECGGECIEFLPMAASSSAAADTEKEPSQVIEQLQTPQKQRPRRRKHRPKVIKPKKPTPRKEDTQRPKRKYVRKKQKADPTETLIQSTNQSEKTCRCSLQFEANDDKNRETRDHISSAGPTTSKQIGVEYESLHDYQQTSWLYFPDGQQSSSMSSASCSNGSILRTHSNSLPQQESPAKKRSRGKGPAQFKDLASISKALDRNDAELMETIAPDIKKKRVQRSKLRKLNPDVLHNPHQLSDSFTGIHPDELWKKKFSVDALCDALRLLDINRDNAMVPYSMNRQEKALVVYKNNGTIVPFKDPPVKKKHPRPRVELDDETNRVWGLLMENINDEGINGRDEESSKWWEEERRVFKGRADSFISRMHLVQGDRRFTPWKGSIVDSVVGVFLTQNVADHLSSSAFISMASNFPIKSDIDTPSGPIISFDSEESMSAPSICIQSSITEEKESVHSNESSRSSSEIASTTHDLNPKSSNSDVERTDQTDLTRDLLQSQESVLTCEQTLVSAANQSEDRSESWPFNYSENYLMNSQTSFMELLQMADQGDHMNIRSSWQFNDVTQTKQKPSDVTESSSSIHDQGDSLGVNTGHSKEEEATLKSKRKRVVKEANNKIDWDSLRREAESKEGKRERTSRTMDSVDWETVRTIDVKKVADTIKERGMSNILAGRIQDFLNRLVIEHGSIDLEWLRDVPPDKAKEYLLSFRGLGLKSVECVRLLTLHHLAFPVDTNVGRIAVRLGWVPLQPLPDRLFLHLLELYPVLESVQKYLWPRLCKLDQKTLYELHYQMITFGKVFCTKNNPNCNACPMRGECRHFASAFASARLALPSTEKSNIRPDHSPLPLPYAESSHREHRSQVIRHEGSSSRVSYCEPIIELPASPEPEPEPEVPLADIEDAFNNEEPEEIPIIRLDVDALATNLEDFIGQNMAVQEGGVMSRALVPLTDEAASLPMPKLKNVSRLRTEHLVYALPDSHPILAEYERRDPDDPSPYLLAIWTPGETANSIQVPESKCSCKDIDQSCDKETCVSCNSIREARSQIIRGTLLIPCRTAMRGSFPLNGTYFQVNEVFADHDTSVNPINVPRDWLWNLPRKTVYFGTSVTSIFKGLSTESIQQCFWRGYVCVRGFDQMTRAPRPLVARLHFPASKTGSGGRNQASDDDEI